MTSKHQLIANPGCGSGWTNNFQHYFLNSTLYFQSAAVVGGRITIPNLHKGLPVVLHFFANITKMANFVDN
ncbi:hypothetical protein [Foetidibacter luteolus]|uniref:hypothetical protein n=1 Tax=Foetidibacter luteolus TaxID=2608880 RepID=UPI001A990D6A|nr:hypothetical protein [Foetidibacter luteolus]